MKNDTEDIDRPKTNQNEDKTTHFKALTLDYELYEHYLEGSDLNKAQKHEFLDGLWSIIVSFVELGYGVHPLQQVTSDACEQVKIPAEFLKPNSDDMVECNIKSKLQANAITDEQSGSSGARSQK